MKRVVMNFHCFGTDRKPVAIVECSENNIITEYLLLFDFDGKTETYSNEEHFGTLEDCIKSIMQFSTMTIMELEKKVETMENERKKLFTKEQVYEKMENFMMENF